MCLSLHRRYLLIQADCLLSSGLVEQYSPCKADSDCPAAQSTCFEGLCLCTPGYYYSVGQNTCVGGVYVLAFMSVRLIFTLLFLSVFPPVGPCVCVCVCGGGGGGDVRIFVLEVMCKTFIEVL